jgi:hypothetical protein
VYTIISITHNWMIPRKMLGLLAAYLELLCLAKTLRDKDCLYGAFFSLRICFGYSNGACIQFSYPSEDGLDVYIHPNSQTNEQVSASPGLFLVL